MIKPAATGYSGTPLSKKLGFKPESTVLFIGAPAFMTGVVQEASAIAKVAKTAKAIKYPVAAATFLPAVRQTLLRPSR